MAKQELHYCSSRNTRVPIKNGFEQCVLDHQCFSDDPCPLMPQFEKQEELAQKFTPLQVNKDRCSRS